MINRLAFFRLACPDCRSPLDRTYNLQCSGCGRKFARFDEVPILFPSGYEPTGGPNILFARVASFYDEIFPAHIVDHYLLRRCAFVRSLMRPLMPTGGSILDVGCGTGSLDAVLTGLGFKVTGIDLSAGMLRHSVARGLDVYAALSTALPFESDTFDLALTVATLHHLETRERVDQTVREMARVVRPGGMILLWDHNPLNPYWRFLMRRVPQDTGEERLVSLGEMLAHVTGAGLTIVSSHQKGFVPDFLPAALLPTWRVVETMVEATPVLRRLAAHNVVVAQKPGVTQ